MEAQILQMLTLCFRTGTTARVDRRFLPILDCPQITTGIESIVLRRSSTLVA